MKYNIPVYKKDIPDDSYKFRPLPSPTGQYPYHLSLDKVLDLPDQDKMTFHMLGDTGNVRELKAQQSVLEGLVGQYQPGEFIYHLGDLVYQHGEAQHYDRQFFKPYQAYPGPVFAIAGNHDGDVNPSAERPYESLEAFAKVFCDTHSRTVSFSGSANRKSNIQPNIYWTLETPLATFIGLYGNIPKFGAISGEQEDWFHQELKSADPAKLLIVCVHNAPYSADINHGASLYMIDLMKRATETTGIRPDIVFSGHVHNYQRFNQSNPDGSTTPHIVAGAGGFDELHKIAEVGDVHFEPVPVNNVVLEQFCDDRHGFLRLIIERKNKGLILQGEYYTVAGGEDPILFDSFMVAKLNTDSL